VARICPDLESVLEVHVCGGHVVRTSLGEEGAESMVIVGGLTLLSEVSVGLQANRISNAHQLELSSAVTHLNAVLEAVELQKSRLARPSRLPYSDGWDNKSQHVRQKERSSPPSTSLQSGNRPGRLYASKVSILASSTSPH
jgi:hypothetical protein